MDYIARTEQALGLADQPRAVVFHVKEGREHCHVVWSRETLPVIIACPCQLAMRNPENLGKYHFMNLLKNESQALPKRIISNR